MQLLLTSIAVSFCVLSLALIGLYLLNKSVDETDIKRSK
jgi:multisubunit Na+/H+ antiporter MnhC subunit